MKSVLSLLAVMVLSICTANAERLESRKVDTIDGDTIRLYVKNKPVIVRLLWIDAPELKQLYGQEAKEYLKSTIDDAIKKSGCLIVVEFDKKDRYGRVLGAVSVGKGKWRIASYYGEINELLLHEGYAWQYYDKDPERSELVRCAKMERRGLWADKKHPIPPWEYRNGRRLQ